MSDWMSKNSGVLLTLIIAFIVQVGAYAVLMETVKNLKETAKKLREDFDEHVKEQGLHRTADSEARITRIDAGVSAATSILTDMKENLAALRATNNHKT